MLELKVLIETPELANAINNLATAISSGGKTKTTKSKTAAPATTAEPEPVSIASVPLAQPPKYTTDQIMAAGASLMDAGKVTELVNLLHSFGVQAVMDLKPEQLGEFATAMRDLGANI